MLAPSLKQPNLAARIGVKSLLGGVGAKFEATNLSARIGVKSLLGGAGAKFEAAKPVSQDWGKVVVGRCWRQV